MNWLKKLFWPDPEVRVVQSKPKHGYEIQTDGQTYWKVITDKEKFYDYLNELHEKVYGQPRPEGK